MAPPATDLPIPHYEQWFNDFTRGFLQGSQFHIANVQLKIDHTWRVLALARRLLEALTPPPETAFLAQLAALFHDVGRFPQYARYQTFYDQKSVNHAAQGVLTLKKFGVLAALSPLAQKLVLAAVALHNRRFLPPGLPPAVRCLTKIVRDADKLDIFAVMLSHFKPGRPHNKVVNLDLRPHPDNYTPAILAQVLNRQMVNYQEMVWVNDFKLLLCSWLYDLNFPESLAVVRERGYVEQLVNYLPGSPEFAGLAQQLRETVGKQGQAG